MLRRTKFSGRCGCKALERVSVGGELVPRSFPKRVRIRSRTGPQGFHGRSAMQAMRRGGQQWRTWLLVGLSCFHVGVVGGNNETCQGGILRPEPVDPRRRHWHDICVDIAPLLEAKAMPGRGSVVCVVGVGQEAVFVDVVGVCSVGHATLASLARTSTEREPFF